MTPEIKANWVTALRSGDFNQTVRWMHSTWEGDPEGHCCLGVLRNIVQGDDELPCATGDEEPDVMPTSKDLEAVGLSHDDAVKLAKFNDDGKSFKFIASYIQRRKTL